MSTDTIHYVIFSRDTSPYRPGELRRAWVDTGLRFDQEAAAREEAWE